MNNMPSSPRIVGVIGLGLMGSVISRRLMDAGMRVLGHDIDPNKCAKAAQSGATIAGPPEIAASCGQIVLALFDTSQVEAMVAILREAAPAGASPIVLCTSTCDPDRIATLASGADPIRFLETPVSGTSEQLRRGQGVALIGGSQSLVDEAAPVLDVLFASRHLVGVCGDGGRAKLAVNLVLGLNRLALAEGLVFAEAMGLSAASFLPVLRGSAAASQVMGTKGPKMVSGDFTAEGKATQSLKDFTLIADIAARLGQSVPAAALNIEILQSCIDAGDGERDNSVVVEELRRRRKMRMQAV
jgi:3-hydroxyisobutyrate dehydrogenase-like beta-hydroxyacid dehydrogenase